MEADINVDVHQEMPDELEELQIAAAAQERLLGFDQAKAISHDEMRARYTQKTDGRVFCTSANSVECMKIPQGSCGVCWNEKAA